MAYTNKKWSVFTWLNDIFLFFPIFLFQKHTDAPMSVSGAAATTSGQATTSGPTTTRSGLQQCQVKRLRNNSKC